MFNRLESDRALGRGPTAPGFATRLTLMVVALLALTAGLDAKGGAESDSVAALRQLVEQQNRKLEELSEKVRLLEEQAKQRDPAAAEQRLPAIVIDTNGVPIGPMGDDSHEKEPKDKPVRPPQAQISAGANGFAFQSADTNFVLTLHGLVQADSRTFFQDNPLSQGDDGFLLRRARPILEGTLFRDFDFLIAPDFGLPAIQLFDAYIDYNFSPALRFRAGKFKGPVGLENLQTDSAAPFNERSLASDLVPMRNVGFEAFGEIGGGILDWAAGAYNSDGDYRVVANTPFDNELEYGGRLFVRPFNHDESSLLRGLGLGVGASYSAVTSNSAAMPATLGGTLPGYLSSGQQQFFAYNPLYGSVVADGVHSRLSPQAAYFVGPFGVEGDFVISDQGVLNNLTMRRACLENTAWQVSAQWMLTGEDASFNAITPAHPFDPRAGHWGAWQLVARYSALDIDEKAFSGFSDPATSARSAASWSAGLNWWLNRNVRILTSFSHTTFQGGGGVNLGIPSTMTPPATVSHQEENILFTRFQVAF